MDKVVDRYIKLYQELHEGYIELITQLADLVLMSAHAGLDTVDSQTIIDLAQAHQSKASQSVRRALDAAKEMKESEEKI